MATADTGNTKPTQSDFRTPEPRRPCRVVCMTPKRVVVTGGAGFLGSHLCDRLVGAGAEVICLDNFFTGSKINVACLLSCPRFEVLMASNRPTGSVAGGRDQKRRAAVRQRRLAVR